jgi:hypothetical protein
MYSALDFHRLRAGSAQASAVEEGSIKAVEVDEGLEVTGNGADCREFC